MIVEAGKGSEGSIFVDLKTNKIIRAKKIKGTNIFEITIEGDPQTYRVDLTGAKRKSLRHEIERLLK